MTWSSEAHDLCPFVPTSAIFIFFPKLLPLWILIESDSKHKPSYSIYDLFLPGCVSTSDKGLSETGNYKRAPDHQPRSDIINSFKIVTLKKKFRVPGQHDMTAQQPRGEGCSSLILQDRIRPNQSLSLLRSATPHKRRRRINDRQSDAMLWQASIRSREVPVLT